MATFYVGPQYVGQSLRDIQRSTGLAFRADVLANFSGIGEDTPLVAGQPISAPDDAGSAEYIYANQLFSGGTPGSSSSSSAGPQGTFTGAERIQAEKDALEKLKPYYEEVLAEARGDVARAKQIIEEDYTLGRRYREEDLTTQTRGAQMEEPRETEALLSGFNRRGLLYSTPRTQEEGELGERQRRRREAITRAISRQEETSGIQRRRDTQELDIGLPRYERTLEEQKKQQAFGIADIAETKRQQRSAAEIARFLLPERFSTK